MRDLSDLMIEYLHNSSARIEPYDFYKKMDFIAATYERRFKVTKTGNAIKTIVVTAGVTYLTKGMGFVSATTVGSLVAFASNSLMRKPGKYKVKITTGHFQTMPGHYDGLYTYEVFKKGLNKKYNSIMCDQFGERNGVKRASNDDIEKALNAYKKNKMSKWK